MWKNLRFAAIALAIIGLTVTACVAQRDRHPYSGYGTFYDEDRDGVRNANDVDRDGDGVVNWRDRFPDDPRYF